jgi:hypothetical protein
MMTGGFPKHAPTKAPAMITEAKTKRKQGNWDSVSKAKPCPICGKPDWCTIAADGDAIRCERSKSPPVGWQRSKTNAKIFVRITDNSTNVTGTNWRERASKLFRRSQKKSKANELAEKLGVDAEHLRALGIGWDSGEQCYTFPEFDAERNVIGILRRFRDGAKRQMKGGKRGLSFTESLLTVGTSSPIFIVEGPTDVAAMLAMGLDAIGRPNNAGGVELVERYRTLYEQGGLTDESLDELQTGELEGFKAGHLGWLPGSSYTLQELRDTAPQVYEDVAIGPLIANAAPNMYIQSIAVNARSGNLPTAAAFAQFVTNRDNQLEFAQQAAIFPSAAGALSDPYFTTEDGTDDARVRVAAAQQVEEAVVYWPPAFSAQAVDFLREQVALAILGDKTAQEALDDAVDYANERLTR